MARTKKPSGSTAPKTGNDYIEHAKSAGALVQTARKGFVEVRTPKGSTYIVPGTQPLDQRTRKNLNHWFKLLGLMVFLGIVFHPLWIQALRNFLWANFQIIF